MPQVGNSGSSVSRKKAGRILDRALKGPRTKPVAAARSGAIVRQYPGLAKKKLAAVSPAPKLTMKRQAKAETYVEKRASQFKKSVAKTAAKTGRTKREVIRRRTGK